MQNMVIAQKEAKCMAKYASVAVFLGMLATDHFTISRACTAVSSAHGMVL
jgi:hypothetical protein